MIPNATCSSARKRKAQAEAAMLRRWRPRTEFSLAGITSFDYLTFYCFPEAAQMARKCHNASPLYARRVVPKKVQQSTTIADYRRYPDAPKATGELGVPGTTEVKQVRGLSGLHIGSSQ